MNTENRLFKTAIVMLSSLVLVGCGTSTLTQNEAKAFCKRTYDETAVLAKYGDTGLENDYVHFDQLTGAFEPFGSLEDKVFALNVKTTEFFFNDTFFYNNLSPNFTYTTNENILTASFKGTAKSFVKRILGDDFSTAGLTIDGYVQATYTSTAEGLVDRVEWVFDITMTANDTSSIYQGTETDYFFWTALTQA